MLIYYLKVFAHVEIGATELYIETKWIKNLK